MASANDFFMKVGRSTATTLASPGYTTGDTSINVASTTNWPADTGVTFAIDEVDSNGLRVSGTYNVFRGKVAGGTQIDEVTYVGGDTNRNYSAGATTRVYILVSSYRDNRFTDGILEEHKQDGTHGDVHATSIVSTGTIEATEFITTGAGGSQGWETGLPAPDTITYNGNRSYDLVFNSTDLTDTLSPGMRLRTTRTVTAPTQCTSLNGTTQYYSKSSPAGMTFTDDFVAGAWVKLSAYSGDMSVVSRYNGTSGWDLSVVALTGQVQLAGFNAGGANFSVVKSYQSIPLNKWVHISAQLDMSAFTATTTTSYVMIDGVDVPSTVTRGGTNPTALVQAGNLEVGSRNAGTNFFPGKIAQVAIYNAKVTQANIRATISQGLSGSETSLISAYSFNNSINDLNTSNANNLTANGSAVATNADSPFGGQASGSISSTLDYAIIQKATFSTNTTLTVQVPEGCTIPTSGGVSAVSYSTQKAPYGFPAQRGKWELTSTNFTQLNTGSIAATAFSDMRKSINLPVGEWNISFKQPMYFPDVSSQCLIALSTVATAHTYPTGLSVNSATTKGGAGGTTATYLDLQLNNVSLSQASQASIYVVLQNASAGAKTFIAVDNEYAGFIKADNAYL